MNQAELIDAISSSTEMTKADVKRVFDAYKEIGYRYLKKEKLTADFPLPGFGKFKVVQRAARKGINPQTGASVKIPARKVPVFRPGTEIKQHIQPKKK
ncbi:HU family DNA-binding protein [Pseudobacteriovorax antillogorgiicola]|uniref:Viral histone-like protein n=1 Tax=Pseudobacteriovorax antillogorgiicola TaxID=1513793 RepID=A0A1Y6BPI3_9BACT|nr:HU family DNA-binding protein [Pseudobacteriovorax antillogorgiicola]TCS53765.1 nucleoid protein HU alpha subunit /nucleoid protein Hbs [Pseudobacteriovorax antillogorgiicola]SMF22501.1 bacterial nucleoid protein HU alpha subunit /bacterial nucleoid protein Hbs [Pseudobacteriovorax antillogorgiicola]